MDKMECTVNLKKKYSGCIDLTSTKSGRIFDISPKHSKNMQYITEAGPLYIKKYCYLIVWKSR